MIALRLFTTTLKNLAIELNAFILTATQISNDEGAGFRDIKNIRGSNLAYHIFSNKNWGHFYG